MILNIKGLALTVGNKYQHGEQRTDNRLTERMPLLSGWKENGVSLFPFPVTSGDRAAGASKVFDKLVYLLLCQVNELVSLSNAFLALLKVLDTDSKLSLMVFNLYWMLDDCVPELVKITIKYRFSVFVLIDTKPCPH